MGEPRVETETRIGHVTALVRGVEKRIPISLTIVNTYHDDGRKDCEVRVPKLEMKGEV